MSTVQKKLMETPPLQTLSERLEQLGFSTNETRILLYLYQHKEPKKADTISEETGVALTRVYETLDNLEQKDFIHVIQGRPRKYQVLPPQEALSSLVDQEQKKLEEKLENTKKMANEVLELTQNLYLENHTQIEADELLLQFTNLDDAEMQTLKIIEEAKEEILIFTHVFQWYKKVQKSLEAALKRGCRVKILMQTNEVDPETIIGKIDPIDVNKLRKKGIEVKSIPSTEIMTRGTIVDHKYVVFVIWADQLQLEKKPRIYRPQFSSNKGIVDVFYGYFQHLFHFSDD